MPLPIDLVVESAGGAVVIAGLTWRTVARIREDRQVERGLDHPDPSVRTGVIGAATAHGMRRHAARLARHVLAEGDPKVLDALALAVACNQWEPVDRGPMAALRQWAHVRARPNSVRDDDLLLGPPADPPGGVVQLSDKVTSDEPSLLADEVAARFGLPLSVLLHRIHSGDIPAQRIERQDGVHYTLRLSDLGIELDDKRLPSLAIGDDRSEAYDGNAGQVGGEEDEETTFSGGSSPEGIVQLPYRHVSSGAARRRGRRSS